jgi:hypothetical protein
VTAAAVALAVAVALEGAVPAAPAAEISEGAHWTIRGQTQLPAMLSNHVIGGIGFGANLERGSFGLAAEAQLLPVVACDASCGAAWALGAGITGTPGRWGDVTSHLALLFDFYDHPGLHEQVGILSARAGFRWLQAGATGVSLDATLGFATSDVFAASGFGHNRALTWAMPGLLFGVWF